MRGGIAMHGAGAMEWVETPGEGVVDTSPIFNRVDTEALAGEVCALAVVGLDEGPYFHARTPDTVRSGMRVRVRRDAGDAFPLFVPA